MATKRLHFTKQALENLKAPKGCAPSFRQMYRDDKISGLAVSVAPTGRKVFLLARWVHGRSEKIKLGVFGQGMTVDQARAAAERTNGAVAEGRNPAQDRREDVTLDALVTRWIEEYARPRKRTWASDRWLADKYLHAWRFRRVSEITRADVMALHRRLGESKGHYTANRVAEFLCALFNRAMREGWCSLTKNPADHVEAYREVKRSRFLDGSEMRPFFQALAEEPDRRMRDFFLLALLCGGRRANVQAMQWTQINWQRRCWIVPAEQSKNGEELTIVLPVMAVRLLDARKEDARRQEKQSPFVFPGVGKSGHIVEPKGCWKRLLKRAAGHQRDAWKEANPRGTQADFERDIPHRFDDLRLHDLRRSLGSWLAGTGASLLTIGKTLGHRSTESTEVYARLATDPVRQAVEKATGAMALAGGIAGLLPS